MSDTSRINKFNDILPVHALIDAAIRTNKPTHVSLHEIAERCGLIRPNSKVASSVMSMLRSGSMRLPLDKIVPVADELGIDRRTLFISQIRDSIYRLVVKTTFPEPPEGAETDEEKATRKAAQVAHSLQYKEFTVAWGTITTLFANTHTERESPILTAFHEVEAEIGHRIEFDSDIVEGFKSMLREQYGL